MGGVAADIAVVGAGPAGAVAACLLARSGRSVLLFEPRLAGGTYPQKPGDAMPGAAARLLRACNLPFPSVDQGHRPLGGNISAWGDAVPVYRDFLSEPDGPGWRLDRLAFEAGLIAEAVAAGTRVAPQAVRSAARDGEYWCLGLRNGDAVTVRWLIDATGRIALLARALGARRWFDEKLVAVVGYARAMPEPMIERSMVETAPEGWWYAALQPDRRPVFMLHTRPALARHLLGDAMAWRSALGRTTMIAQAFPNPSFTTSLSGFEACGAQLDPVHGDGWVACGDAAISFDPCSAQGIFSALWGGMAVAAGVGAALAGDQAPLAAYAAQLGQIRAIYRSQVELHYAEERRWPSTPFWSGQPAC
jgi:flavin-dependent dehydrogenase